jgi:hypothetical protein
MTRASIAELVSAHPLLTGLPDDAVVQVAETPAHCCSSRVGQPTPSTCFVAAGLQLSSIRRGTDPRSSRRSAPAESSG